MTTHDSECPQRDDYETERLRELEWRYAATGEDTRGSNLRVGEVCTAAIIALGHAYQPIEFGYNGYYMAATLDDDFNYDTLGQCIEWTHQQDMPNLSLDSLRLVDRILATYEGVMVDHLMVHAVLDTDDDTRSRYEVEASIGLRCGRMLREVQRQLHVEGDVTAAEAALDYVARVHGTPIGLLRAMHV